MTALPNVKHEQFALNLASGKGVAEAYATAGFKANAAAASKLHKKAHILQRVAELRAPAVEAFNIDMTDVLKGLHREATLKGNDHTESKHAARVSAWAALGKLIVEHERLKAGLPAATPEADNDTRYRVPGLKIALNRFRGAKG